MEPATRGSRSECINAGEDVAAQKYENSKKDEKTNRRGKLKLRIHVGNLRNALGEMEQELSGLKKKYEAKTIGEQRCLKRSPKPFLKPEHIKGQVTGELSSLRVPDIDVDEKDIVPEKDVGFIPHKPHSKLPVLDKSRFDEMPKVTTDILTKVVGLETLYGVLMEEHLGLQLCLQETTRRLRAEERRARDLEERRNPINLALAERIGQLEAEAESLRRTVSELREENDHLEFRLLEMDELPIKKTVFRSAETTRYDSTDIDDVSDSGVMSLPASDDEHQDFTVEAKSEGDIKSKLLNLSQNAGVSERICLQQGLALLRHYEARIEALESTIAAMCSEATLSRSLQSDEIRGSGRIIATVLPFTERKDCLQESGIFEEAEWASRGTQTESRGADEPGDLSTEIEKLTRIREKIETGNLQPELPPLKQLAYYRERVETLESRLAVYEARPDEASRLLKSRLDKEARLEAEIRHLREKIGKLEMENRSLEEERCELEEAENDTRLRCQKLELKLSALGEKKSCLKAQVEQLTREMATREEEKKQTSRMEAIVKNYEKKNQELEERELEVRYRLQMLENTMPALMMWNMWRMMMAMQAQGATMAGMAPVSSGPIAPMPLGSGNPKEDELILKLQALEARLNTENRMLQESRNTEETLRNKVRDLEMLLDSKDTNIMHILDRDAGQDVEAFEKLSRMAKERVEMDRRIKDLELKEKMYQETLQQVDVMFSDMEGNYTRQLQEKDDALYKKENQLAESEHKLRQAGQLTEMNLQLQEKLVQLESEMKRLTEALKKREAERESLEKEEKRLNQELQECLRELDTLKQQIEGPMKGQLEVQKKRALYLEEELEKSHSERLNMEAEHKNEVSTLKNRINQLNRDLMESDVTIGELREEVQTLEMAIDDLRYMMSLEKANKEELKKEFEAKLEEKERLLEELKDSMKTKAPGKSLKDELEEMIGLQTDIVSTMVSAMVETDDSEEVDVDDLRKRPAEEIYSMPADPDDFIKKPPEICEEDLGSINSKTNEPKQRLRNELKSKTVHEIHNLIKEIDRGEPLLEYESTKGILTDLPIQSNYLPLSYHSCLRKYKFKSRVTQEKEMDEVAQRPPYADCQIAQNAVNTSSGKDIKGTVDNLTKAFQHSKTCKTCNETLGSFLGDLIKELGVRLPSVNKLDDDREPEYAGQPSTLTSKEVGAGTVGWDVKKSETGYKLKPTVSTLALTVAELQDKCKLKDAMIQAMADEFRHLSKCQNWSGADLMTQVADVDVAPPKIDFDRRALCNYLNSRAPYSLYPSEEEEQEFQATNPLGLKVVRQIGPDSIIIEWNPPPPGRVHAFEIFVNGLFLQRVRSPGRTKAILHPIDLSAKLYITLNALTYTGEPCEGATIPYP